MTNLYGHSFIAAQGIYMDRKVSRHQSAKWSLWLVLLVVFVCSGQNTGMVSSCPLYAQTSLDSHHDLETSSHAVEKKCDLTDHLLQLHQQSLDHALISIGILLLLITMCIGNPFRVPLLTEPITSSRRRHLTLCVFRE